MTADLKAAAQADRLTGVQLPLAAGGGAPTGPTASARVNGVVAAIAALPTAGVSWEDYEDIGRALVALIFVLTAYSLVADAPDRLVIMSRSTFEARIAAERIAAARETLDIMECPAPTWRGLFRDERPTPINPM